MWDGTGFKKFGDFAERNLVCLCESRKRWLSLAYVNGSVKEPGQRSQQPEDLVLKDFRQRRSLNLCGNGRGAENTHVRWRIVHDVSKRALQLWKLIYIYSENSVLNCYIVARHTEFYVGYLSLNLTFAGDAGCFKKFLQWYSKCYSVASVTKKFTLKGVQTTHRSRC
jgi:hypothetical protein